MRKICSPWSAVGYRTAAAVIVKCVWLFVANSIPADVEEVKSDSKEEKRKAPRQKKVQLTDRDYEEMPTENLDWEKITAEEKERMKDWALRKEKELVEQASELQFRLDWLWSMFDLSI